MITLHITSADGESFNHPIKGDSLIIGRAEISDLKLHDRFLSRRHTRLYREGGVWMIEDLGSRNGTWLNAEKIESPSALQNGDFIRISSSSIVVHDSTAPVLNEEAEGVFPVEQAIFRPAAQFMIDTQNPFPAEKSRNTSDLQRYAERLRILNEVHQALGHSISLDELLELILDRVFDHLQPEQGAISLKGADGRLYRAAERSLPNIASGFVHSARLTREVAGKGLAALVLDARTDERFASSESLLEAGVRSLVAAPFLHQDGPLGMIVLRSTAAVRQFSEGDMELLVSLASVASLRIHNVALAEEAAEKRRLEKEMVLARRIQNALLPDHLPEVSGYEIHGENIPSRVVSGDYYAVFERREGCECVLLVADVSGKGIGASILTGYLEALSSAPIEEGLDPGEVFTCVSRSLYQRTPAEKYATEFLAVLDPATGTVRYANAGHNPAILLRGTGEAESLTSTGMPLGLFPEEEHGTEERVLAPADTLIIFTDGITEAANRGEEEYGRERLVDVCRRHRHLPVPELAAAINKDLDSFVDSVPFDDDRTIVILRRHPEE